MKNAFGTRLLAGVFAAGIVAMAHTAFAQAQEPHERYAPPSADSQQMEVSDTQLRQFIAAATTVSSVQQEYSEAIQSTQDVEKAQSLREEAQENMIQAVEGAGLSVSEYNLISQQIQADPDLQRRFQELSP